MRAPLADPDEGRHTGEHGDDCQSENDPFPHVHEVSPPSLSPDSIPVPEAGETLVNAP